MSKFISDLISPILLSANIFDKWNYIIDRWGLFNPPGVGPFDKDPDNDIPFSGFDREEE